MEQSDWSECYSHGTIIIIGQSWNSNWKTRRNVAEDGEYAKGNGWFDATKV